MKVLKEHQKHATRGPFALVTPQKNNGIPSSKPHNKIICYSPNGWLSGAVSPNSATFGITKMPVQSKRNIKITT